MPATKIGICHATVSGMVRWWVIPDADDQHEVHRRRIMPGESYILVDRHSINSPADIEAAVEKAIGRKPAKPVAIGSFMGDPDLDR